ncbi:TIGR03751 family conjugal transfer lipoprotein [Salmonella enterica subsp. enterica serovar Chester]|nr:TIGR03751 family conjugal transfer lipoprotein [Salmonella enterica subsp. enterica serovar Chester]
MNQRIITRRPVLGMVALLMLSGCGTSKEAILPAGDNTMLALWQNKAPSGQPAVQAREALRRPLTVTEQQGIPRLADSYSRTQESEISQQFPRLPNPDMVMYVFPHLAGGTAPVPGYSTVFPFYSQTQYALPGERTESL